MDEQGRLTCKTLTFKWLTVVVNRRGYSRALSKRMEPGSCQVACNGEISDSCTWISISLGLSLFI